MNAKNLIRLPTTQDIEQAKNSSRILAKYAPNERLHLTVRTGTEAADELILPSYALDLLLNVLTEMAKGNALTLMPIHAELSTQEAANLLNISRPYLVSLLEAGQIPFHKVGAHRRVLAEDVMNYKQQLEAKRLQTLDELTSLSQDLGMGYE